MKSRSRIAWIPVTFKEDQKVERDEESHDIPGGRKSADYEKGAGYRLLVRAKAITTIIIILKGENINAENQICNAISKGL